jgi:hypothetical protein
MSNAANNIKGQSGEILHSAFRLDQQLAISRLVKAYTASARLAQEKATHLPDSHMFRLD